MNKIITYVMIGLLCIALMGCSNGFAKKEYNATDKIAETQDRYAKENSVFNPVDHGYSLKMGAFDGRETLWEQTLDRDKDIELKIKLCLGEGTVKIVHIDEDEDVSTIMECTQNEGKAESVSKSVSLKKGYNRIKIVGYGCKEVDLKLPSPDF